jgi:hypothetical protein
MLFPNVIKLPLPIFITPPRGQLLKNTVVQVPNTLVIYIWWVRWDYHFFAIVSGWLDNFRNQWGGY